MVVKGDAVWVESGLWEWLVGRRAENEGGSGMAKICSSTSRLEKHCLDKGHHQSPTETPTMR